MLANYRLISFQSGVIHKISEPIKQVILRGLIFWNYVTCSYSFSVETSTHQYSFSMVAQDKYKDTTINGSIFPDAPIHTTLKINLNSTLESEYLPTINRILANEHLGFRYLLIAMTYKEGFSAGTRSYTNNNPGNIGNTDSGANQKFDTLEDGILAQKHYILNIVNGKSSAFPMGKLKVIKPYYSPEIAKNPQYGLPPFLPGYTFTFTGQLDQFVKIYSTGARAGNSYLSTIISYFNQNGLVITPESKLQDFIQMGTYG